MNGKEFIKALDNIIKEKGISEDIVYEAMEQGLTAAYKKNYGGSSNSGKANSISIDGVSINRGTKTEESQTKLKKQIYDNLPHTITRWL